MGLGFQRKHGFNFLHLKKIRFILRFRGKLLHDRAGNKRTVVPVRGNNLIGILPGRPLNKLKK